MTGSSPPRRARGGTSRPHPQTGADRPADLAAAAFRSAHGRDPSEVWSAPGRVNLIGEHTDYNDGYVLPFALPHRIAAAAAPRRDTTITVATLGSDGHIQHADPVALSDLRPGVPGGWASYVTGVAWVLREQGLDHGADIVVAGDVPSGAGLSSSAALECAAALALRGVLGYPEPGARDRIEIAGLAQRAENEFVGVPTGSLDQTASMCCAAGHVLFLDVHSGETAQVPFDAPAAGQRVLVIDTRVKHSHAESGYGDRRRATSEAAQRLGVASLREITPEGLPEALRTVTDDLAPLVRHVVSENARVLDVVQRLRNGRPEEIGPALSASHDSLRDDYRVSCPELDLAVESARDAGALGARMTGGGFGGSAIALVRDTDVPAVENAVLEAFRRAGAREPRLFSAVPAAGAGKEGPAEG